MAKNALQIIPDEGPPSDNPLLQGARVPVAHEQMIQPLRLSMPGGDATPLIDVGGITLPLNPDGTVTLFHATKTPEQAARIIAERRLRSAAEPSVYLSTHPSGTGYGDHVVSVDVDPQHLNLDDEFPDGRADFRIDRKSYRVNDARVLPSSDEPK